MANDNADPGAADRFSQPDRFASYREALDARASAHSLRQLEHFGPEIGGPFLAQDGKRLLNFSSNDYLGLATDPDVREGAAAFANRYGAGSTASRLTAGGFPIHEQLETELADFTDRSAALLFNSGFQANTSVMPALVNRGGAILADRLCHHSLLQGALLSGAKLLRFRHNDMEHLDQSAAKLAGSGRTPLVIVTESVFSMDGDRAPLGDICEVAHRYGALLMVDDAHALGVWGRGGQGLAASHERIDLLLGTFGKALGASGAFVASSDVVRSQLVNYCGGVIYSTAPPPPSVGAVFAALNRVRGGTLGHEAFRARIEQAHHWLRETGFDTRPSDTQILPIYLGDEESALRCASFLRDRGILAQPIRPPTVPRGSSRLRVSLTRLHSEEHLSELVTALQEFRSAG